MLLFKLLTFWGMLPRRATARDFTVSGSKLSRAAKDITKFINEEDGDMFELLKEDLASGRLQVIKLKHFELN